MKPILERNVRLAAAAGAARAIRRAVHAGTDGDRYHDNGR